MRLRAGAGWLDVQRVVTLALVLAIAGGIVQLWADRIAVSRLASGLRLAEGTSDGMEAIITLRQRLGEAQGDARDYVHGGDQAARARYGESRAELDRASAAFEERVQGSAGAAGAARLGEQVRDLRARTDAAVAARDAGDAARAIAMIDDAHLEQASGAVRLATYVLVQDARIALARQVHATAHGQSGLLVVARHVGVVMAVLLVAVLLWFRREIRQRIAAETALAAGERRLHEVTENVPVGVAYVGSDETIRFANGPFRELAGPDARVVGENVREVLREAGLDAATADLDRALAGERAGAVIATPAGGTMVHREVTLVPARDETGGIEGVYGVVYDVSERQRQVLSERERADELERRVAERTEQLRNLAIELESAEDRERRQIARDLHDDLAQTLAAARVRLAPLCEAPDAEVRRAAQTVGNLVAEAAVATRTLASQLAPTVLYEIGLPAAIEWLGEEVHRMFGLRVSFSDDGLRKPMSDELRSLLYRAVRELLINVAKHARTDFARVESLREDDHVVIVVSDGGIGFDLAVLDRPAGRQLGLRAVRERLAYVGGTVQVRPVPGDGTEVVLRAPLSPESVAARAVEEPS